MKKETLERKLLDKAREIRDLVRQYAPGSDYIDVCIMDEKRVSISNNHWCNPKPIQIVSCALEKEEEA